MQFRYLLFLALLGAPVVTCADEPSLGPVIDGYGPTFPVADRDVPLEEGMVYRAVFDAARYSDDTTSRNGRIVSVARFLNMHARNGVPPENMELAVVVHGAAVKNLMTNAAYESRYGSQNPNLELISKLRKAGVRFFVCGQSMSFGGISKEELSDSAEIALSAMTMLTVLQNKGFALLP